MTKTGHVLSAKQVFVADLLPLHDLSYAKALMEKSNNPHTFRKDVEIALQRACERRLEAFPSISRHAYLKDLETISQDCMKVSGVDTTVALMLAIAYRNLKMLEMGWITDPTSQEVLMALMITLEAEEDGEHWGDTKAAKLAADKMINHLRGLGLYLTTLH